MDVKKGELLTLDDSKEYLVIDKILFEGKDYIFTNEMFGEDFGNQYHIFELDNDGLEEVLDQKKIELLMPVFNNGIKKALEEENFNV